jgi:hypothetical protein
MRIDNSPALASTPVFHSSPLSPDPDKTVDRAMAATSSISVSISGQTLVRQRLFLRPPDVEPPMRDIAQDLVSLEPGFYLNKEDRHLLGEIYEFAQSEGIDLGYVDDLGRSLAHYRSSEDGQRMGPHNRGNVYDLQGHMLSYSFTDPDTVAAQKVRDNPALAMTRLDKGFINFQTDKDYSALSHCNFEFLDFMINRFSPTSEPEPVDGRFQRYEFREKNWIEHVSKEVYDIPSRRNKSTSSDPTANEPKALVVAEKTTLDLSETLRQIVHKYLRESGLPTLFDTLRRLGK